MTTIYPRSKMVSKKAEMVSESIICSDVDQLHTSILGVVVSAGGGRIESDSNDTLETFL